MSTGSEDTPGPDSWAADSITSAALAQQSCSEAGSEGHTSGSAAGEMSLGSVSQGHTGHV